MKKSKLIERFKEVLTGDEVESDFEKQGANRVTKEAYICKRLKMTRSQLYETCIATGIDVMYDELRRKSGAR